MTPRPFYPRNRKPLPMEGKRFGRWTVISFDSVRNNSALWLCQCDCGNKKVVNGSTLRKGQSKSCGCFKKEADKSRRNRQTHGLSESGTYKTWEQMLQRCNNPKTQAFQDGEAVASRFALNGMISRISWQIWEKGQKGNQ